MTDTTTPNTTTPNTAHTPKASHGEPIEVLAQDIKNAAHVMVVTGAGISVASGITPFRKSPNAHWEVSLMEIATHHHFKRHPEQVWSWYLSRFTSLGDVRPNPAHEALVTLEQLCEDQTQRFTLVTQNVDTLHSAAGSRDVIEVHGSSAQLRCSNEGECALAAPQGLIDWNSSLFERFLQTQEAKDLPCCPRCDELLRPHVLWFDESYHDHEAYRFSHVVGHMKSVDLVLFVGTSFSVGITELIQRFALQRGASLWAIDPHPVLDECADEMRWVVAPSEEALPQLVEIYRAL